MGDTYRTPDGVFGAGDYTRFTIFENSLATRPFGLVQREFPKKEFLQRYPNTGGKNQDGRVVDCLCRIDVVLRGKTGQEYPLLTPIVPMKQLFNINRDEPAIFMKRVGRWAIENKRAIYIGKFKWEDHYESKNKSKQKFYECVDILLNAHMDINEIADASRIILAGNRSPIEVVNIDDLDGKCIEVTDQTDVRVRYLETGEMNSMTLGKLFAESNAGRVTNAEVSIKHHTATIRKTKEIERRPQDANL